ncbi:7635_t:CDS:2, partial [Racocetra persica]
LFEANFERHWAEFIVFLEPFPKAFRYALETLYPTPSIQSTQRIESINRIIKKEVSRSTTLLHLVDTIQNCLNEEAYYLLYDAAELSIECDNFFSEPENIIDNGCREDNYEQLQIGLKSLLQNLRREYVEQ